MLSRVEPSPQFRADLVAALPMLRKVCISWCKNPTLAEDLVQEVACRAVANHHQFIPGTNFGAWLTVIAKNSFRNEWRKLKNLVEDPDDKLAHKMTDHLTPDLRLIAKEALQLIGRLPQQQRDVLLLLADGATYDEVATELVEQVGTIKSRANRARVLLHQGTR